MSYSFIFMEVFQNKMRDGGEGREKAFQDTANTSCDPMELSKMAAYLNHLTRFLDPSHSY